MKKKMMLLAALLLVMQVLPASAKELHTESAIDSQKDAVFAAKEHPSESDSIQGKSMEESALLADTIPEEGTYVEGELLLVYDNADLSAAKEEQVRKKAEQAVRSALGDVAISEVLEATDTQGTTVVAELSGGVSVAEALSAVEEEDTIAYAQPNYLYELTEEPSGETLEFNVRDANVENNLHSEVIEKNTGEEPGEAEEKSLRTEENVTVSTSDPKVNASDTYYLYTTHTIEAWKETGAVSAKGKVSVAVFDTGCDMDHPDLDDNLLTDYAYDAYLSDQQGKDVYLKDRIDFSGDTHGHGTKVCGLISAEVDNGEGIAGTSYNAGLIPVKIYPDGDRKTSTSVLYKAYNYICQLSKAHPELNLRLVNISAAYQRTKNYYDKVLENAIKDAENSCDILTICAAGNFTNSEETYPADFEGCLSVISVGKENAFSAAFSHYGAYSNVAAPGEYILTTNNLGGYTSGSSSDNGTSFSAPIVTGICAFLLANHSDWDSYELFQTVVETATTSIGNQKPEDKSAGVVNALAALQKDSQTLVEPEKDFGKYASIKKLPDVTYTGERIRPVPEVWFAGEKLDAGNYTIKYINNLNAGTCYVEVTGKAEKGYSGTTTTSFVITKATEVKEKPAEEMLVPYETNTVSKVSLPEGWEWADADAGKALTSGTTIAVYAKYTGADAANYTEAAKKIAVKITRALHTEGTDYLILSGANATWTEDEGNLTIRGDGDFAKFVGVKVDESMLAPTCYSAVSGSTVVTLYQTYLKTLAAGKHSFEILWTDGSAKTQFTVVKSASGAENSDNSEIEEADQDVEDAESVLKTSAKKSAPDTSDNSSFLFWCCMLIASFLYIVKRGDVL